MSAALSVSGMATPGSSYSLRRNSWGVVSSWGVVAPKDDILNTHRSAQPEKRLEMQPKQLPINRHDAESGLESVNRSHSHALPAQSLRPAMVVANETGDDLEDVNNLVTDTFNAALSLLFMVPDVPMHGTRKTDSPPWHEGLIDRRASAQSPNSFQQYTFTEYFGPQSSRQGLAQDGRDMSERSNPDSAVDFHDPVRG